MTPDERERVAVRRPPNRVASRNRCTAGGSNRFLPSVIELQRLIVQWAEDDPNVLAVVKTGSSSGSDGRRDEFSDLDVEIIAAEPEDFLADDDWFHAFGRVWVVLRFDERRFPTRLVVYEDGSKVDYTVASIERLTEMHEGLDSLYERGYEVLLDKRGVTGGLPPATGAFPVRAKPSEPEFIFTVEEFWFEATHMPRYLSRGDLWVVKFRDWTMKRDLLRMLEWRAVAVAAAPVDVWHIGTRMHDWIDEATWRELHDIFGRFAAEDAWRALLATTRLFGRVSRDVADACGFRYPEEMDEQVQGYLTRYAPVHPASRAG